MGAADLYQLFGGAGAGVVGVCVVIVVLFITGQIVTKKQLDDQRKQDEARVEEIKEARDEWKKTAELERTRAEAGVVTGQIVRDVMLGIRKELN